jgi:hypothetical protein
MNDGPGTFSNSATWKTTANKLDIFGSFGFKMLSLEKNGTNS